MQDFELYIIICMFIICINIIILRAFRIKEMAVLFLFFNLLFGAYGLKYLDVPLYPFFQLFIIFISIALNYKFILYYKQGGNK